jgi:hypothetical protein
MASSIWKSTTGEHLVIRRSTGVLLLVCLATGSSVAGGASEPGPAPVDAPMPLVFRGGGASGAADRAAAEGLAVPAALRGRGAAADAAPPVTPGRAAADDDPVSGLRVLGGEKLWLVDLESERVIACRERNTATVGRRAIECTGRTLRALAR